ncbi:MAG: hypothetical protein GX675_01290 [Erysipelotrichaceae bacterium]|nr:hypothetical protein [Erysipelotrichaceae bacterium]
MREKINYLKSEMQSYNFYVREYRRLQEEIAEIDYKLTGVSGIDYTKPMNKNKVYTMSNFYELMLKQDDLKPRAKIYEENIKLINQLLGSVDSLYRGIIEDIYINKCSTYEKIANKNYRSVRSLKSNVDRQIRKFIKEKGM